jgi:hypothetical protein
LIPEDWNCRECKLDDVGNERELAEIPRVPDNLVDLSPLQMNDQDLHVVNSHKHLGVIISDNGQWNDHIDYIVKKNL